MKYIFLSFFALFFAVSNAQIFEPVSVKTSIEYLDNDIVRLKVECAIEEGWNIYALTLESDDGPIPSSLLVTKSKDFEVVGKPVEDKFKTKDDAVFGMKVNYHSKKATFYQDVKLKTNQATVKGVFEFMACNYERCLPPEQVSVQWKLEKKDGKSLENAPNLNSGAINIQSTDEIYEPIQWEIRFEKQEGGNEKLVAFATLDKGWHLYATKLESNDGPFPTRFELTNDAVAVGELNEPKPIFSYDPNYQLDLSFHENEVEFTWLIAPNAGGVIEGELEYMVCNEEICLPSEILVFSNQKQSSPNMALNTDIDEALIISGLDLKSPKEDCGITSAVTQEKKSNWGIFLLGFVGGLIALLTPCVFPMIPLTVSFFTKGGTDKGGKWQSVLYGAFIVAIYLLLSTPFYFLDSINPEILNTISTNVYLNVFFFVIFVIFAISFFGFFEITVPSKLTNKIDSASNVGGIIGIFFMALTLSLVSFSCTGPILGSLLAGSLSADGGAIQLSAGMGGFGLALALPFALFAAFPSVMKKMPQSGSWLNTVKVVLGFVELALAIKFLSNADLVEHWGLLKREVFIGLWIVIGIGLVLYLFAKIKFPHDSPIQKLSIGRRVFGIAVLAFVLYLIPGVTNTEYANRRLISGFPPPLFYSIYEQNSDCPLGLECYKDYNEGLAVAKATNKPILLDFTGWACVNCRKMEENVWVEDDVYAALRDEVVLVSLYVDDRKELPADEQFDYVNPKGNVKSIKTIGNKWATFQTVNFVNNSQPFYVLISPEGELLTTPVGNTPNAKEYLRFLRCGIDAYKKQQ